MSNSDTSDRGTQPGGVPAFFLKSRVKRVLFITAGCCAFFAGVIGIFLPILPTTPFLLLAAACFLRSSRRLFTWLTGHRIFGRYIVTYLKYKAVSPRAKIVALIMLWASIITTIVLLANALWLQIALGLIAVTVTIHLLRLKTLTVEILEKQARDGYSGRGDRPGTT